MADFCCFALNPKEAIEKIGYFDSDNFFPAYYEDNDYLYRVKLSEYEFYLYGGLKVHHEGSKTQFWNGEEQRVVSHDAFRANQQRYIQKWGGLPGSETFVLPFNGVTQ
jgi:GT2 family glycosyltransferase